jgi:hypothetical protein
MSSSGSSLSLWRQKGLDKAVLTALLTVALAEFVKFLRQKYNKKQLRDTAGPAAPLASLSGDPERGRRWYTYQTW